MDEELVFLQVEKNKDQTEVLRTLAKALFDKGFVKEGFSQAVIEREKSFPTGLQFEGYGIAIPHTDSYYVNQTQLAVMTLKEPVYFTQMATQEEKGAVRIVIMLAIKEAHGQLDMLQKLIGLCQDSDLVQEMLSFQQDDSQKLLTLLQKHHII
ncbi:PTS sugar transporter subunit IIA [Streptococcus ictaluri]|uniref:Phosphoenolpyruvate-dependent sugar PTS family porter, EIIA 2 n=1 Tax=Streptococcus ictaluri 707-05 TaxID=764299 RepID=G5K554_9STRE|nr:PTS sugar transporter subunit IIA [Streptococcus ictaluri]EHI69128.1 phosphoenolpyruvate-dependent sugar PTS family porter, EIIA 2 [Streptococcus ictaluri 707-05]